jgi:cell wall-associated NlpC family hydrolase
MSGLAAFALFAALPATLPTASVREPVANMYSRPSLDSSVVSQAVFGATVTLLESSDGWSHIRTADDYTGWTPATALLPGRPYPANGKAGEVESLFAHLYREPDVTRHAPLLTVPFESKLELARDPEPNVRWFEIRLPDSRAAWVQSGDVTLAPRRLSISETLQFAKRFLGLPYTWGGTSSYGYDCSGFSQMLARRRGVSLPRDAQPQAEWSGLLSVERKDLQPGDLLYFGNSPTKITHTGVYMGDGKFISATTHLTPAVRIDELADPHWTRLLVAARRVK